jgi:hypothetical protein
MSLFDSIFGKKSKSKTTVQVPSWIQQPMQGYMGDITSYLGSDPHQYVAPASELQNLAFDQAKNLGSWQDPMNTAFANAQAAGSAPAANAGTAVQTNLTQSGPASTANVSTYAAPTLGPANQSQNVTIDPTQTINGASLLDNFNSYLDPALQSEVDAAMANYERQAAQTRAAQQAHQAGLGNWGSGGQFYMSNFDNATNLGGAALEAQLRAQAYRDAMAGAISDADRRQGASAFNAGAANTRSGQQAGMNLQNNQFNTGALNDFDLNQALLNANAGQFNANANNQVGMFNAGQQNDLSMFNTGQANQVGMFNTGQTNSMSQYNAGLENAALDRALQAAGLEGDMANMMGSNQRADTALVGSLGDMQHSIDQAYASALPTQLLNAGQMFGSMSLPSYFGQTTKGTASPSPFQAALSVASLFG